MREDNWKNLEKKEREAELPQDAADAQAEKFVLAASSLEERLQDIHAGWSAPRVKQDWSAAVWRPQYKVAQVILNRCKFIDRMGYTLRKRKYLYVEEAVYLVARCDLLLLEETGGSSADPKLGHPSRDADEEAEDGDDEDDDDVDTPVAPRQQPQQRVLSLQEAYEVMIASGFSMERFMVYSHLSRVGYIVFRKGEGAFAEQQQAQQAQRQPQQQHAAAEDMYDPEDALFESELPPRLQGHLTHRLPNLAPLRQAELPTSSPIEEAEAFDVYQPSSEFGRKKQPLPDFRIAMAGVHFPSADSMARIQAASGDIPVVYAVVDQGDIDFFSIREMTTRDAWR